MLILEKTATTTRQSTPYLEYENCIIDNLGSNDIKVQTIFFNLNAKMIADGAVVDTIKGYGSGSYQGVSMRRKSFFGLRERTATEIGFITFWTESGESDVIIRAFNGVVQNQKQWKRFYTSGNLLGEDNTEVSSSNPAYELKKEFVFQAVPENSAIDFFSADFWSSNGLVIGYKITFEDDEGHSQTIEDTLSDTTPNIVSPVLDSAFFGVVVVKLYLKRVSASPTAYNEMFKVYQRIGSVIEY